MAENFRHQRKMLPFWCFWLHVKKRTKRHFFRYSVTTPHPTAKPSWGWLRVVVRKLRLVLVELDRTRNKVTAKAKAYWRGCSHGHLGIPKNAAAGWPPASTTQQHTKHKTPFMVTTDECVVAWMYQQVALLAAREEASELTALGPPGARRSSCVRSLADVQFAPLGATQAHRLIERVLDSESDSGRR